MSDSLQPHRLYVVCQGFSRQEYWSGLTFPSPKYQYILPQFFTTPNKDIPESPSLNAEIYSMILEI